jgi:membrane-associated phospholipid phosphatase
MLVRPALRRGGIEALAAGALAGSAARVARDWIARPRPGTRPDGGLPSRHAAAAVAIALIVSRRHPRLRPWLVLAATAGLTGRVVAGDHDPADIAAGAALGWASDWIVERVAGADR